jgi:hypothetical protein
MCKDIFHCKMLKVRIVYISGCRLAEDSTVLAFLGKICLFGVMVGNTATATGVQRHCDLVLYIDIASGLIMVNDFRV